MGIFAPSIPAGISKPTVPSIFPLRIGDGTELLLSLPASDDTGKINLGLWEDARTKDILLADHEGLIHAIPGTASTVVPGGIVPYEGARVVENLVNRTSQGTSDNINGDTPYEEVNGAVILDSTSFRCDTANSYIRAQWVGASSSMAGRDVNISCTVRSDTNGKTLKTAINNSGGTFHDGGSVTLTTEDQRFSWAYTSLAGDGFSLVFWFQGTLTSGEIIYITDIQIEDVTGQSNQNPSKHQRVDVPNSVYGFAYYTTENGNTVDGSSIVTEAVGAALSPVPTMVGYPASANKFRVSRDLTAFSERGGTEVITADAIASKLGGFADKVENLGTSGNDDIWYAQAGYTADAPLATSVWVEDIGSGGTLKISSTYGAIYGEWNVDLSVLSGQERLTNDHTAVTVVNAFVATSAGGAGFKFATLAGTVDVSIDGMQQEEKDSVTPFIYTAGSVSTRDACGIRHPLDEYFNQAGFTCVLDFEANEAQASFTITDEGLISVAESTTNLLFADSGGLKSADGTSTATVNPSFTANTKWRAVVHGVSNGNFQGSEKDLDTPGSWAHGTAISYDGTFISGSWINLGYGSEHNLIFHKVDIYNSDMTIVQIEALA